MECCERKVDNYVAYENAFCAARDFIHTLTDEITSNADTTGDMLSVSARLQRITELAHMLPKGCAKVEACVNAAAVVSRDFHSSGRQTVLAGIDDVQKMWHELEERLSDAKQSLTDVVKQWNTYKEHRHALDEWLKNMENSLKQKVTIKDVDEIRPLVKAYQVKYDVAALLHSHTVNSKFSQLSVFLCVIYAESDTQDCLCTA